MNKKEKEAYLELASFISDGERALIEDTYSKTKQSLDEVARNSGVSHQSDTDWDCIYQTEVNRINRYNKDLDEEMKLLNNKITYLEDKQISSAALSKIKTKAVDALTQRLRGVNEHLDVPSEEQFIRDGKREAIKNARDNLDVFIERARLWANGMKTFVSLVEEIEFSWED